MEWNPYRSSKTFQIMCFPNIGRFPVFSHFYEVYYYYYYFNNNNFIKQFLKMYYNMFKNVLNFSSATKHNDNNNNLNFQMYINR